MEEFVAGRLERYNELATRKFEAFMGNEEYLPLTKKEELELELLEIWSYNSFMER